MRRHLVLLAAAGLLAGCSFSIGGASAVTQDELEKQVAGLYTAEDPEVDVTATCEGELEAEVDATQDCHLDVGEEDADVHVVVTQVNDGDVDFESQPYVPADRVAETIQASLGDQGYEIESVECDGELKGELDATTTCSATPADGDGAIEVTVTQVDGLMVNFNYKVVS